MIIRPRRTLAAVGAAAVLAVPALTLAGCGGGSDDSATEPPAASVSASTSATAGAGSSRSDSLADVLTKSMKDGKSAHVRIDMGSQGSGEGDVSFAADSPVMQMDLTISGQQTQMRLVDGSFYVAMPGQSGKFVKMDTGEAGATMGLDPSQAVEQLQKAGGEAKDLGDGHWQISKDGTTTDLFVGDDGYLEKVQVEGAGSGTITMTYSDWGKKVTVKAPSPADIVKAPGL